MWTNEKIPAPSRTRTHRLPGNRPGTTLGGQAWRGQLGWEFYQYYYQLYQLWFIDDSKVNAVQDIVLCAYSMHKQKHLGCKKCEAKKNHSLKALISITQCQEFFE